MITQINARTAGGRLLNLTLDDISDGYVVSEVEGLGPVKASIISSSYATLDGVVYQAATRGQRDIKIKIELEPDYTTQTVESLRLNLYSFFMPKSKVNLEFISDTGMVGTTSGRVESCEPVIFTDTPTVEVLVSCFDPDFIDPTAVVVNANTVSTTANTTVEYSGSSPTGFRLVFTPNRIISDLTLWHTDIDGVQQSMEFGAGLAAGDTLTITTTPGAKSALKLASNVLSSVMYGITPVSAWPQLQPGTNYIRLVTAGAALPYTIDYFRKYGGL